MSLLREHPAGAAGGAPSAAASARGPVTDGTAAAPDTPWLLAARAGALDADERAAFLAALPMTGRDGEPAPADRFLLETCQRIEWYGRGPGPEIAGLVRRWPGLLLLEGDPAIAHAMRLGAGLDSAIVGEDHVLHQLRLALREARRSGSLTPELGRLVETAIGVGRRARARGRSGRTIATLALERLGVGSGRYGHRAEPGRPAARLLIVGAGTIGEDVARAAVAAGFHVVVASRTVGRAEALAARVATGRAPAVAALDLAGARSAASMADAVVVALAGVWPIDGPTADLPPILDLSAPPALDAHVRAALGTRWTGIDELMADARRADDPGDDAYAARAGRLAEAAAAGYRSWLAGRSSVAELRRLADRAERRRAADVAALHRRLEGLSPGQRAVIDQFSEQLVARLLHEPLARLRVDDDGAVAAAARRVFGP